MIAESRLVASSFKEEYDQEVDLIGNSDGEILESLLPYGIEFLDARKSSLDTARGRKPRIRRNFCFNAA